MIIGVVEYGEVRIFDNIAHVLSEWGQYATDVESEVIVFYDADGAWLEPILTHMPRRWFGLRKGATVFTLHRNIHPESKAIDPISQALNDAETLMPNSYFKSLDELRTRFSLSG
jgi:hypothetical protein